MTLDNTSAVDRTRWRRQWNECERARSSGSRLATWRGYWRGHGPPKEFVLLFGPGNVVSDEGHYRDARHADNDLRKEGVPVGNSILLATDIESSDAPALCERFVA